MGINITTNEHTGNYALPQKSNRAYFLIIMTSGEGTVKFGGGTGGVPLAEDHYYEPLIAPTSEIEITSTGTYVIAEG
jgi:hypothetical protein